MTPSPIQVREARARDANDWHRMRVALYAEPGRPELDPPRSEVERYFAAPGPWCCLVALSGERLIGFCEVGTRPSSDGCRTSPVAYLEGIWVEPSFRRTRVGALLVEAAEGWARERGLTEMGSDCSIGNTASLDFHLSCGFIEANRTICLHKSLD